MDNPLWERILIDWVNCLKLSTPIQKLDDLRDGSFFTNLYKVIKKSSKVDCDVLTSIFDTLSEHYAEFVIPNKSEIHLHDLPKDYLCAITSLLMHYTCIHDRRDVLTSPLCFNLQEITQIKIKTFLELIQECTQLNYTELSSIIKNCMENIEHLNLDLSSINISCVSPLHSVLQTPIKSCRIFQRDKEITKLKAQVELFQEEKENLEKDLKGQIEKSKKLEKQLSQKKLEISNLRSEVMDLEDRTPPYYRDKDFREMQKILRIKVDSLEKNLEQSDKENLQLREERDQERAQVKQLESRCKTWLEKFIDAENNLQSLTENYKEQLKKNENLRAHCSELENLLEELRPKSNNDSCTEESFHNSIRRSRDFETQEEDLAQSVVDVQLKEIQKENETLKVIFEEVKNDCKRLKDEINTHVLEKSILHEEKRQMETELQEANGKIEEFMLNYEQLLNDWKMVNQEKNFVVKQKSELSDRNEILKSSIKKLQQESVKLTEELEINKKEKRNCIEIQKTLEKQIECILESKENLEMDLEKITIEKCQLSDKTDELKIKNNQLLEEIQTLTKENDIILEKLKATSDSLSISETSLKNISKEKHLIEEGLELVSSKIIELTKLNVNAEKCEDVTNQFDTPKNKENLQIIKMVELQIENLIKDNGILKETIKAALTDKEYLNETCESLKLALDERISENDRIIKQSKELFEEKTKLTNENNELYKDIERLENSAEKLKGELATLVEERNKLEEQLTSEYNKLDELLRDELSKNDKLENDLRLSNSEKNEFSKNILTLQSVNEELNEIITCKEQLVLKLENEIISLNQQLELMELENSTRFMDMQKTLEKQIECILESKVNLEMDLEKITIEKCQLCDKTDELKIKNNQLLEEIQTLTKENDIILEKLKATSDSLSISETSLKNVLKEKHLIEEELELVSSKIIELTKLNVNAEKCEDATNQFDTPKNKENLQIIKMVELQIENLTKDNGILKETVKAALTDKEYLNETCESLKLALDERISENDRIIKLSQELFEEKTKLTSENNELYKDIERLENSVEKLKGELATLVEEREKLEEQLTSEYNKLDELLRDELSKNDKLENDLRLSNSEKNEFSKNILTLQSVNEELNEIITCKEQLVLKLENEIISLNQQLELMERENSTRFMDMQKTLEKQIECILESKVNLEMDLKKITIEKCQLCDKTDELKIKNNQLLEEIQTLTKENDIILEKLKATSDSLSISETSLKNVLKEKHLIEEELELVSSKIIELTKIIVNAEKCEDATNQFDTPKNKENLQIIKMVELQIENLIKDNGILKETIKAALTDKEYLNETCESLKLALDERISENDRIIKQSKELFEEKTKLTNENNELYKDIERLENLVEKLKGELATLVEERNKLEELTSEYNKLDELLKDELSKNDKLENDLRLSNSEKNEFSKNILNLQSVNEELNEIITCKEQLVLKLENEIRSLNQQLELMERENSTRFMDMQKTLEKQIECILESKENLEMDLEKITIEKCQLSDKTDELKIKNNQLLEEIQTLTKENDIILEKLKATSDSLSISETSLKNISKEKHLIEEELELVSSKIIELTKLNVNAEKYEDATNQFDTPKNKENLQIIKMVELQIENLTKDNGILKETVKAALTDKEYLNETCESLKLALDERISENDRIIKQSQELFEEKTKLTSENNELYKDIERLENSVEKLKGELATFVEEREKLEEQLTSEYNKLDELLRDELSKNDKLENDLRLSNSEKNEFSKNILTLQSVNEELNEIITCKEQLVLKLENEIRSLKQQLELMEIENSTILDNLKMTTDKMLNLERSLEIVRNENSQYLDKLTSANTENESLKLNIIHLNEEIESILNKCEELTDNVHKLNEEKTFELENKSQTILDLNDLKMQLKVTNDDNEKLIVEKSNLSETLKVITVEKQQLADDLMFLTDKYNALEFEYKALKSEKQVLVESVYAMQFEKDQISDKLSQVTKSLKCAVDDFSQENKLLTQKLNQEEVLQKAIKEKDTALDHLQVKISDNEIAILELKEINNKLEISNNELTDKLAVMLNENTILKDRINNMEEATKLITTLSEEKDSLLRDVNITKEETVKELEASKMEIEKLQSELENLALEKTDTLYKLSEEKRVISDFLDLNNNELQKVLQEKEVILGALEFSNNEMVVLQEEKETLLKEIEKLTKVKNEFSEQLDKTSQENVDLSEQLQNILKKNHENAEQVKDLKEKVTQLTEENTQLLGKLTTVSNDLEETAVTNESLKTTCSQLKKELEEKSELLEKISEEHKDIFDIVDRLSKEKIDMGHTIDTLSEENMLLKQNLSYSKNQVADLMEEKTKLIDCLDLTDKELQKVKKDRNDILEGQTKIMKETQSNLLLAHQSAVDVKNDLLKRIETAETEKEILRKQMELDTKNIQESYASVLQANSKLELEIISLRKKLEDKNQKRNEYVQIKEAYEKLLEENSKLLTDIDTIKYKRSRDRDEFVSLLKKEREDGIARENKKIKDVRFEYENKLEKMKEKMLKLYRDEVGKEMMKVKAEQSESMCLVKTIEDLKNELFETQQKLHMLETERDMLRINAMHSSRESLRSVPESRNSIRGSVTSLRSIGNNAKSMAGSRQTIKKGSSTSVLQNNYKDVDRRTATLPRAITQIQETVTISRRTSLTNVPNIEMEDEDDDFNNKYLADLKAGQCIVGDNGRESIVRFSELAWRNSMLPPHLKSSYPAETQFVSPSKFREDELKGGNIELDDSLSKLLPGEKPRQKKDFGTTTYKKPGPPTPSKNGGRLSLQGNEIQPLREQNERTPKKLTPSRIKALFMGKSSIRDNSENQPVTPRTKQRLSIFRKQR